MALIDCPECSRKISDKAEACPHCGLPRAYFAVPIDNSPQITPPLAPAISHPDFNGIRNMLISFERDYHVFFRRNRYIPASDARGFSQRFANYVAVLSEPMVRQFVSNSSRNLGFSPDQASRFLKAMDGFDERVKQHNESFVDAQLIAQKEYLDNILKAVDPAVSLDEEQRRAVLTDEDYCLLIAGAGAGKTTTMAAKVKYLVDKLSVAPEDIIVISYTNKAIDELRQRINHKLGIPVKVCTFHSFGYEILRKSMDTAPTVNYSAYGIIFEFLEKKVYSNHRLLNNLVLFLGFYFDLPEDIFKFSSLAEFCAYRANLEFESLKSRLGQYIKTIMHRRTKSTRTITGEFLRSVQEVQIANCLYLNGIDYEYEKPYQYPNRNSRKMYTPDFFIRQGENEAYIEHFGISEAYQSTVYSREQLAKYVRQISEKRELHRTCGTTLIETWSQYKDGRPLLDHLREVLERHGFVLMPRNYEEVYRKLADTGKDKYVWKLIMFMIEFIEKFKTCGYDQGGFEVLREKVNNVRVKLFLDIAEEVYLHYQNELQRKKQIDFSDMINDAESLLREMSESPFKPSYRYIIIDEFQDIARQRFNLTKTLADVTSARVVAVGDDWQSIFAFAGSDITLFQRFLELMGEGKEMHITRTYRNSQELIDIAGGFVQKNPTQIRKRLLSPKRLANPIVVEAFKDSFGYRQSWAAKVEEVVGKIVAEFGPKKTILMIGRYNFDRKQLCSTGLFEELGSDRVRCVKYPQTNITFLTAHSSKGLGFDNVILVNMLEAKFGFPSQLEEDPIMKLVTHEDATIPFAEERRLFYVALTRTKNRVYMVTPQKRPSRFVLELMRDFGIPAPQGMVMTIAERPYLKCPVCQSPLKLECNKNYGLHLYMCTNDPEVCDFMTNDRTALADIFKCIRCPDGYMIVKRRKNTEDRFYGCTNYDHIRGGCTHMARIR